MSTQGPLQGRLATSQLGHGVGLTALDLRVCADLQTMAAEKWKTKQEAAEAPVEIGMPRVCKE